MDQQLIKKLFTYKDGELYWNTQPSPFYNMNTPAGSLRNDGYKHLGINNKIYYSHRIIWVYHYGDIPKGLVVDHANGDRQDNRIENLRVVTQQQNVHNNHTAKGYSWYEKDNKFKAYIKNNGIKKYIGSFQTECGARLAYLFAKLNRTLNYGRKERTA